MLYSTVPGGLIMLVVGSILMFLSFGLAFFIVWPACIIWAVMAAKPTRYMAAVEAGSPTAGEFSKG